MNPITPKPFSLFIHASKPGNYHLHSADTYICSSTLLLNVLRKRDALLQPFVGKCAVDLRKWAKAEGLSDIRRESTEVGKVLKTYRSGSSCGPYWTNKTTNVSFVISFGNNRF